MGQWLSAWWPGGRTTAAPADRRGGGPEEAGKREGDEGEAEGEGEHSRKASSTTDPADSRAEEVEPRLKKIELNVWLRASRSSSEMSPLLMARMRVTWRGEWTVVSSSSVASLAGIRTHLPVSNVNAFASFSLADCISACCCQALRFNLQLEWIARAAHSKECH